MIFHPTHGKDRWYCIVQMVEIFLVHLIDKIRCTNQIEDIIYEVVSQCKTYKLCAMNLCE